MNINTNIQSFSSQSGIKVTQNGNSNQSIDKNKNSEAVNINIDSKTLDTLNLLSSLEEETFIKSYNNFISDERRAIRNRLEEVYQKQQKRIKNLQIQSNILVINITHKLHHIYRRLSRIERE